MDEKTLKEIERMVREHSSKYQKPYEKFEDNEAGRRRQGDAIYKRDIEEHPSNPSGSADKGMEKSPYKDYPEPWNNSPTAMDHFRQQEAINNWMEMRTTQALEDEDI